MLSLDDLYTHPRIVLADGREHRQLLQEGWRPDVYQRGIGEGFVRLLSPKEIESNRQAAAKSALRCFFKAWACWLKDDQAGVAKWLRHVQELSEIVRDG